MSRSPQTATPLLAQPTEALPVVHGPWLPLSDEEAQLFVVRLNAHQVANGQALLLGQQYPLSGLRAVPLRFYPGWLVVSGEAHLEAGLIGTFDVLLGPDFIWLMDGDAAMLHVLNRGLLKRHIDSVNQSENEPTTRPSPLAEMDPALTADDYARFYCNAVRGERGSFHIVENNDDLVACGANLSASHAALVKPPVFSRVTDEANSPPGSLQAQAIVIYGGKLYQVELVIDPVGTVSMQNEELLADNIAPIEQTRGPLRQIRPAPTPPKR